MDIGSVVLIAIGLAMDAFAVSICKGLAMQKPTVRSMLIIGLWFGGFQAIMPMIGYFLGSAVYDIIESVDHWIAFFLLLAIGLNMVREGLSKNDEELDDRIDVRTMLLLAIATSIDALAVGISFAMDDTEIFSAAALIGVITFAISAVGVRVGSVFGTRFGARAEIVGGLVLVAIGFEILMEHLGYLRGVRIGRRGARA